MYTTIYRIIHGVARRRGHKLPSTSLIMMTMMMLSSTTASLVAAVSLLSSGGMDSSFISSSNPIYNITPEELQTKLIFAIAAEEQLLPPPSLSYEVKNLCGNADNTDLCRDFHISSSSPPPSSSSSSPSLSPSVEGSNNLDTIISFRTFYVPTHNTRGEKKAKYRSSYVTSTRPFPTSHGSRNNADDTGAALIKDAIIKRVEFSLCGTDRTKSAFCRE